MIYLQLSLSYHLNWTKPPSQKTVCTPITYKCSYSKVKVVLRITTKDWLEKLFWNTGPWIYWSNIKIFNGTRSFDSVIQRLCLWYRSKLGISYIENYLKYLHIWVLKNGYIYKLFLLMLVIVIITFPFYLLMIFYMLLSISTKKVWIFKQYSEKEY